MGSTNEINELRGIPSVNVHQTLLFRNKTKEKENLFKSKTKIDNSLVLSLVLAHLMIWKRFFVLFFVSCNSAKNMYNFR